MFIVVVVVSVARVGNAGTRGLVSRCQDARLLARVVRAGQNGLGGWNSRARVNHSRACPSMGGGLVAVQRTYLSEGSAAKRTNVRFLASVNELFQREKGYSEERGEREGERENENCSEIQNV